MAEFRFGRQPFRFEPTVFQEPKPEIRAFQQYEPTPRDRFSQVMNMPAVEQEPNQPAGLQKGSLFDIQRQEENEYPMMDKFSELLSQRPQREDYKPSVWRNIISAVGGVSSGMLGKPEQAVANAYGTTEKLRDVPFDRATQDWTGKIAGYGEGAKMELQKADKENKFLAMLNNAYRTGAQETRWQGQTANEAERNRIAEKGVIAKIQAGMAQGWRPVRANGRMLLVKAGEPPQDIGEDRLATIAGQNAATAERGERNRTGLGWANVALGKERNAIAQTNAETGISRAEIALMDAETRQDQAAISYYRAQIAGEQFNRQLENDIFNQALRQAEFDRGDKSPEARAMLPTQRLAAYRLAMSQVINDNPELADVFDDDGKIDPNADADLLDNFTFLTRQRLAQHMANPQNIEVPPPPKKVFPKSTPRKAPAGPAPRGSGLTFPTPGNVPTATPPPAANPAAPTFLDFSQLPKKKPGEQ